MTAKELLEKLEKLKAENEDLFDDLAIDLPNQSFVEIQDVWVNKGQKELVIEIL